MIKRIFKDEQSQIKFDEQGFVVVDLINKRELDVLNELYKEYLSSKFFDRFSSTNIIKHKAWRIELSSKITEAIKGSIDSAFKDINLWYPAFLVKPPSIDEKFYTHQDWSFVDEKKFYSGNIWIPLDDTNYHNGTLCVIPKTHFSKIETYRSKQIREVFNDHRDALEQYAKPISLKKGQALIFQHSMIHFSPVNQSSENRIVVNCGFNSYGAQILAYKKTGENTFSAYSMNENFMFLEDDPSKIGDIPQYALKLFDVKWHKKLDNLNDILNYFSIR